MLRWGAMLCAWTTLTWVAPAWAGEGDPAVRVVQPSEAPPRIQRRAIEIPRDGRVMVGSGSAVVVGGALLSVFGAGLLGAAEIPADQMPYSVLAFALGGGGIVAGSVVIASGRARLRSYREWEAGQAESIPSRGNEMIGTGAGLLIVGVAMGVVGGWAWAGNVRYVGEFEASPAPASLQPPTVPLSQTMLGLGAASCAAGAIVLGLGVRRNTRHMHWRQGFARARLELAPRVLWLPGGMHLGLGGRF